VPSAPFLPLAPQITLYCATLFSACMICHGELARLKPPASRLTGFYLLVAVGGALGGVFCSLIAPVAFTGLWEYPCGLAALCLLLLVALVRFLIRLWSLNPRVIWGCILVITAVAMTNFVMRIGNLHTQALATTRNFYGVLVVDEKTGPRGPVRRMLHGRVSHGIQFLDEPLRRTPVAYHGAGSGLGLAEAVLRRCVEQEAPPRPLRIGVAGLGAGILAAYGRKGDTLRFYEINPDVVRLAHEYFTYLSDTAATVEMVQGDARMVMEQERAGGTSQQFDLLALDAFSGDAVPLHLLTREAFALYVYHLAPRGVLAFNISSQHLDMAPLIFGLARDGGKRAVLIEDWHRDDPQYFSNRWVLVSSDEAFLQAPEITGRAVAPGDPSAWLCFTDDYSNLFQLVKKRDGPRDGDGKSVH
jgi:predicted O-methyltransferase YrrM